MGGELWGREYRLKPGPRPPLLQVQEPTHVLLKKFFMGQIFSETKEVAQSPELVVCIVDAEAGDA
jgi:hypothetical protein